MSAGSQRRGSQFSRVHGAVGRQRRPVDRGPRCEAIALDQVPEAAFTASMIGPACSWDPGASCLLGPRPLLRNFLQRIVGMPAGLTTLPFLHARRRASPPVGGRGTCPRDIRNPAGEAGAGGSQCKGLLTESLLSLAAHHSKATDENPCHVAAAWRSADDVWKSCAQKPPAQGAGPSASLVQIPSAPAPCACHASQLTRWPREPDPRWPREIGTGAGAGRPAALLSQA